MKTKAEQIKQWHTWAKSIAKLTKAKLAPEYLDDHSTCQAFISVHLDELMNELLVLRKLRKKGK